MVATVASGLSAHSLKTASGYPVSHSDASSITSCSQTRCPSSDATFERDAGFRSADLIYPNNFRWNCHGRTFDGRRSWTSYADMWVKYDASYCPAYPKPGHTVIWWQNGKTSHSVTIVGPWKGLDTIVMSKYGAQGQYKHTLRNAVRVYYPGTWSVIGFGAGTVIYSGSQLLPQSDAPATATAPTVQDFLAQREQMPWYQDVLASEVIAGIEHSRLVAQAGALTAKAQERIARAKSNKSQVAALLDDLRDASHYSLLAAYNSPEFTEDYISAIESGKALARLASSHPRLRLSIIEGLFDVVSDGSVSDYARGSAVHVLGKIMSNDERRLAREELRLDSAAAKVKTDIAVTYLDYYLSKL